MHGKERSMMTANRSKNKKWYLSIYLVAISFLVTCFLLPTFFYPSLPPTTPLLPFAKSKLLYSLPTKTNTTAPPRIAYLVSGSAGDGEMLKRTLQAVYHPHNTYIIHLDAKASPTERQQLLDYIANHAIFSAVGNVRMIERANLVTYRGPTMIASTLHATAILLRDGGDWDWFINLSASDYPLVTQDDLLHVLSSVPRSLNFIHHTGDLGWKEDQRAKPIIIDPGLYKRKKEGVFWVSQRRELPTAFKLFTGSAWMALTHSFIDYCIHGWDNLPRKVLMYHSNFISSPESYFHTVISNSLQFRCTAVSTDLHFIQWHSPPRQHPHTLDSVSDILPMLSSNAPFARKFSNSSGSQRLLDWIDRYALFRGPCMLVPGGWCDGTTSGRVVDGPCSTRVGNVTDLRPAPGADRLHQLFYELVIDRGSWQPPQCRGAGRWSEMESERIWANSSVAGGG